VCAVVAALSAASLPASGGARSTSTVSSIAPNQALAQLGLRPLKHYTKTLLLKVPFESATEAQGWYVTPQTPLTRHQLSNEVVHNGKFAHQARVTGPNVDNIEPDGPNHRGYPTIQLHKRPRGCVTPCLISLWVWADIATQPDEWFQIATLTASVSDAWLGQLVNVGSQGWLHTMHVPSPGLSDWVYQRTDKLFPLRTWVNVKILIEYRATGGAIAAFQDGVLISAAPVDGTLGLNGLGVLNQAHFGMYVPPTIGSGVIYNDNLTISEVR
jgi:hypothetical protein